MLNRLRRRFVTISMIIISCVLVFFFMLFCSVFVVSLSLDMRTVLGTYSENPTLADLPEIGGRDENGSRFAVQSGNVCIVEVMDLGSVKMLDVSRANMDEAILKRAVEYVSRSSYQFGHIDSLNLFYSKTPIDIGMRIAFADSTQYFTYLETILFDGAILLFISFLILWAIMRFLAKMCLKPVEKAWLQQKNFIADASHELKTPLTVILTNSGILKSHPEVTVGQQIQWVDSTYEEASHMKELVDKLLLLAKTEDISKKNMFSRVNLSELTMQLALQYEPVAFEKGVFLNTDIDNDIELDGDSVALNQIIHILLDNAIKYSPEGDEVMLSLKKRHSYSLRKSTGYIYLSTRNMGNPIPPEDMPHIFERFYRSDKARTFGSGYGLGLAICKNLASLHNADISVSSDVVHGTVFTVKFKIN